MRTTILGVAWALAACLLPGCASGPTGPRGAADPSLRSVRIGYLPVPASLPLYVALDRRLFEAEGLNPLVTRYGSSDELGYAASVGRVEVMSSLALNVAFAIGQRNGEPSRLFGANVYSNRPGEVVDFLVARKGSGIARTEDLAHRRVAAFPGSVSRLLLLGMLSRHGLGEHDVDYTELPPPRWREALASGAVDAAFVLEPEATEIVESGVAVPVVKGVIAEFFPDAPLSGHWVTSAFAGGARRDLVPGVLRAYQRALDLIRREPDEARRSYARHTGVPEAVAAKLPLMRWAFGEELSSVRVQAFADLLRERGALPGAVDVSRYLLAPGPVAAGPELRTVAERSGFRATSSYDETLAFLRALEARSPHLRLLFYGTSGEGRPMPLVVVSREGAFTAAQARRVRKPVVLVQNGIHAGEIDGKDASLRLLRELALGERPEVLERVTLLVLPIYNVDGHERVSRFNRSEQDGPVEGMGFRTTATGLDLNRDHMKLVSAEARALVSLVNEWRPHLHVDNHVSDGFEHAWSLGTVTAEAPQAAPSVNAWVKAHLPAVSEATRRAGHPNGPYVELLDVDPGKGAMTPAYRPRYSTGYFPLRNRPSILVETHSHKPYAERVAANHAWLAALLDEVARSGDALVEAVDAAERRTVSLGAPGAPPSEIALRLAPDRDDASADAGAPDRLRHPIYAWDLQTSAASGAPMAVFQRGVPGDTELPWWHTPRVVRTVPRPRGYLVLPGWPLIEQRLAEHGLRVEKIRAPIQMEVETVRVSEPVFAGRPYQGLTAVTSVAVARRVAMRRIPAGALWVPADQPDFEVAAQLLEPEAPDSLLAWGLLSQVFEIKEGTDPATLHEAAQRMGKDPAVAAEWQRALVDPRFAKDPGARERWWYQRTPYWDETVGLMPFYRVMKGSPSQR